MHNSSALTSSYVSSRWSPCLCRVNACAHYRSQRVIPAVQACHPAWPSCAPASSAHLPASEGLCCNHSAIPFSCSIDVEEGFAEELPHACCGPTPLKVMALQQVHKQLLSCKFINAANVIIRSSIRCGRGQFCKLYFYTSLLCNLSYAARPRHLPMHSLCL